MPQGRTKGVATMAISKAIPFLQAPAKLDGSLVGDYGASSGTPTSPLPYTERETPFATSGHFFRPVV